MKKTLLYLAAAVLIAVFPACGVDEVEINNVEDFEAYVLDEMDFQNIPAAAVLVFEGEEVLYENYFGSSNLEQDLPLAADHLFLMASVSKVITATALLQLHETGAFELNDRINDYLPFNVSVPSYSTDITFQMLLTHTSGIADNFDEMDKHYYYGQDSPIALSFFIENYLVPGGMYYDGDKNFTGAEPGTEHEYSNIGTALIGVLVEELSGTDFNTYCQQNIFSPLGMEQTSWRLDQANGTIVTPYDDIDGENQAIVHYTNTDYPNGGLRTTARDMHQFLKAFVQGGLANNHQLLSAETINDMIRLQIPNLSDEMGLHLFLMDQENNLWGHDGGEQGVATIVGFNPNTKIGAIIFTNQGEADVEEWLSQAYTLGVKL
jgi:CubicO group peptidase (beta-lactamase class C family)